MRSASSSASELSPTRRRLDEVIAGAMVVLVLVYSTVSFLTYYKISSAADNWGARDAEFTAAVDSASHPKEASVGVSDRVSQIYDLQHHSFPLHVGSDTEEIVHPGLALVKDSPQKAKELPTTLKVPKFFEDSHGHVYGGSIREYLGGGNRLPTPLEAKSVGSFDSEGRETIYASVASYRDYECRLTVEDLYARAKYPNRIRVAIIDQIVDGDDKCNVPVEPCETNPDQSLCKYAHLIDYYQMDARLAVGPVFARHMAHRFYRGEYFGMQVRALNGAEPIFGRVSVFRQCRTARS
jgi:Glycosyltransferase (GlcNAc)